MKEIFIKYNPYKVETEITIDDKKVKTNSALNVSDRRLQEWIDDLPKILLEECNTNEFHIKFQGTLLDYEDLLGVVKEAEKSGIHIDCTLIPARDVKDKESEIKKVFEAIKIGPFEELRDPEVLQAFNLVMAYEFPVSVVATVSAGKSTLINALLQKKILPTKNEACSAVIIEIRDNDKQFFNAWVYDVNGKQINIVPDIDQVTLKALNDDQNVSKILLEGNIPFVKSDNDILVMVDTPGPNSARHPEHKAATYRMLSESSKTLVLYVLNATQSRINDDDSFLNYVSDSMKVRGKQSRDRFIFVINKLDEFKTNEDSVEKEISEVKGYLEDKGIMNPHIFPLSALTAFEIRTSLKDLNLDSYDPRKVDDEVLQGVARILKLVSKPEFHLERYAPLSKSCQDEVNSYLECHISNSDMKQKALVHTGIISLEVAIKNYLEKYSRTAKIKSLVDTFSSKLESAKSFERTRQEIVNNEQKHDAINKQIEEIKIKRQSGNEARKLEKVIESIDPSEKTREVVDAVILEAQSRITDILENCGKKLSKQQASDMIKNHKKFAETLLSQVQVRIEDTIMNHMRGIANTLADSYRQHISLFEEGLENFEISLAPVKWISLEVNNSLDDITNLISKVTKSETVKVGERFVPIGFRAWINKTFGTEFTTRGYFEDITENRQYIDGTSLSHRFFTPIEKMIRTAGIKSNDFALKLSDQIKQAFSEKFTELDKILERKFNELTACLTDKDKVQQAIIDTQMKLKWLAEIQDRINDIIDI